MTRDMSRTGGQGADALTGGIGNDIPNGGDDNDILPAVRRSPSASRRVRPRRVLLRVPQRRAPRRKVRWAAL